MNIILRQPEVMGRCGQARTTLFLAVRDGLFPRPVKLGARSIGWPSTEVDTIIAARIAGLSTDEIKALVIDLHAKRTEALQSVEA